MAATARKVNLTNVKEQGQFSPRHVAEGDYPTKVAKVDDHKSKEGNEMWVFTLMREGDARATYPYYVGTDEKAAWKVRKLLLACGFKAPKSMIKFDPNRLVGKMIGAAYEDDEYEGKVRSRIADVFHVDEMETNASDSDGEEVTEDEVVEDDTTEDEDDTPDDQPEDEDAEPDPAPAPKKRARPAPKVEDDTPEDMDLSDLDEL